MSLRESVTDNGFQAMRKKINASMLAKDIRSGMGGDEIVKKHGINPQAFERALKKMLDAGVVTHAEIQNLSKKEAEKPASSFECPRCRHSAKKRFVICPRCGHSISDGGMREEKTLPMEAAKVCANCGHRDWEAWEGNCPNCGVGEGPEETDWDPVAVIFRFFATAICFGLPVSFLFAGIFFRAGYFNAYVFFLVIPAIWGVLGIFFYEKITSVGRHILEEVLKGSERNRY